MKRIVEAKLFGKDQIALSITKRLSDIVALGLCAELTCEGGDPDGDSWEWNFRLSEHPAVSANVTANDEHTVIIVQPRLHPEQVILDEPERQLKRVAARVAALIDPFGRDEIAIVLPEEVQPDVNQRSAAPPTSPAVQ